MLKLYYFHLCRILGVARYDCFNQTSTQKTSDSSILPDSYYDESDPANDIEDYPTEISEVNSCCFLLTMFQSYLIGITG